MSLPRYREYLPTGNPLIPKLPADWSVSALRTLGKFLKGRGGSKQDASESGIPCIRYGELYTTFSYSIRSPRGFVPAEVADSYEPISKGDVLFAASGEDLADIGRSAVNLLDGPTVCGGDLVILRPTVDVLPEFLGFACDSTIAKAQKSMMGRGTTVKHIYPDELRQVVIALPPRRQQEGIARFLEKGTAAIDALIAEQERLIALLQEKRQAVISHAVTKGLDPNVPMKDSGAEWIGRVPSHWSIARTGRVFRSIGSGSTPPSDNASYYDDTGVEWVNTGDLPDGPINSVARRVSSEALSEFKSLREYPAGAVVIAMYGATIGKLGILTRPAVVNQACCVLSDGDGAAEPFLFYALLAAREAITRLASGGTQPNISQATVRAFLIPVPPIDEQFVLVAHLNQVLSKLDALVDDAEAMIALLRERRAALITAAVTGQIDVRGLVETAA